VWTVNTETDARRLLEWGVDALITDRPDIMVPLIKLKTQTQKVETMNAPTLQDIYAARTRVYRALTPSPLLRHPLLSRETGLDILIKHENHNPTGAFKVRGGLN